MLQIMKSLMDLGATLKSLTSKIEIFCGFRVICSYGLLIPKMTTISFHSVKIRIWESNFDRYCNFRVCDTLMVIEVCSSYHYLCKWGIILENCGRALQVPTVLLITSCFVGAGVHLKFQKAPKIGF